VLYGFVQVNLLGGHCFGFNNAPRLLFPNNFQNDFARLLPGACPMDFRSARFNVLDELLQILIQMIDSLPLISAADWRAACQS